MKEITIVANKPNVWGYIYENCTKRSTMLQYRVFMCFEHRGVEIIAFWGFAFVTVKRTTDNAEHCQNFDEVMKKLVQRMKGLLNEWN